MIRAAVPIVAVALAAVAACGGGEDSESSDDGVPFDDDGEDPVHVVPPQTCFAPTGLEHPRTIADLVTLLNVLPKPVSVGCLLQTLPRPLTIEASSDQMSFQPAFGPANPRILIHTELLTITVVPTGEGSNVVEMSELREADTSTKGELPFPITVAIQSGDPFVRVQDSADATKCSVCHINETLDSSIQFERAFKSKVLRPLPQYVVPLEDVVYQFNRCDSTTDAKRCEILDGIFGYGEVVAYAP